MTPGNSSATETEVAESRPRLDAENPWPGLDAYGEGAKAYFKGRKAEAAELVRMIRLAALTVVYGKSGLGKTSLLEAGLFPLLRAEHYLPVPLRLGFSLRSREQSMQQAMKGLKEALEQAHAEFPESGPDESLWEYLHRKKLEIWSTDNYLLTPVLVFDQFEELFSRSRGDAELVTQVFNDLADLIENRIPAELAREGAEKRRSQLDLLAQNYRIVLSFREDFLPEVRACEKQIPSLLRSYLRLEPMTRSCAIEAVEEAGTAVLAEGVAKQIVDFVGRPDPSEAVTEKSEMAIEPVLLSLCCTQLNRRRAHGARIDETLLKSAGEDILESFYRDALQDPEVAGPPPVGLFIEDKLLQGAFRGDYPRQEALDEGRLTGKQLAALTDRLRLLRIVPHADTARIELIHDRLVPVVAKTRDERILREQQEEHEKKAAEAEAERDLERARSEELRRSLKAARRNRDLAIAAAVASCILLILGCLAWVMKGDAERSAAVSTGTARLAEGRLALAGGTEPLEQAMYRGLAAYRLRGRGMSQARAASLTALHWVLENSAHLRKAVTIGRLVPTPALAYSPPDGRIIAVGGEDGLVRLLDAETFRETREPLDCQAPPKEAVWSLAFRNDGKRLAAGYATVGEGSGSGLVCVFDVAGASKPKRWSATELWHKPASIFSVAYGSSQGEEFVVSGGEDGILRMLDLQTGEVHETPPVERGGRPAESVVAVTVSADGRLVASAGDDRIVRIWTLDGLRGPHPRPLHELSGHEATIQQIEFSPADPSKLVSAGNDGRIIVWDVDRSCSVQQSNVQKKKIYGIAVRPNGELVAAASMGGNVELFPLSKEDLPCIPGNDARSASTVPSGQQFGLTDSWSGHGGSVLAVAWNPDGTRLASTGQEGSVRIWGPAFKSFSLAELLQETETEPARANKGSVTKMAIGADGRIAAGDDEGNIAVWDRPAAGTEPVVTYAKARWKAHAGAVRALAFVTVGGRLVLVSGGDGGRVKRWEVKDGAPIGPDMLEGWRPIASIAVSPNGRTLAAGSEGGAVCLWDAVTGAREQCFQTPKGVTDYHQLYAVAFADDQHLAIGDYYDSLLIHDLDKSGSEHRLRGHNGKVQALGRSQNKWLVSGGEDGGVLEWEPSVLSRPPVEGLKKRDDFKYRMGFRNLKPLTSLDVSADGGLIVTGGSDGQVQLWDGVEHVLIGASFVGHGTEEIRSVAMAPDGSFFVSADAAKILVWPGPDQWADLICSKLVWNMSTSQWREWISPKVPYKEQCPKLNRAPD